MRVVGLKRLKQGARWLRTRFARGAVILGYHSIAEANHDPYSIRVSPKHFTEQLEVLRKHAKPIRLLDVVQEVQSGMLPARAVALTFDDGYKDHLLEVKPLLEKYQIPATVFVTTGYFGGNFWWNELEEILLCSAKLPQHLTLQIGRDVFNWRCIRPADLIDGNHHRQQLLLSLYQRMLVISRQEQESVLAQLWEWTGTQRLEGASTALTRDQVAQLASGGLIEIGAHSVTHPLLNRLPETSQRFEILRSKACLEKLIGQPVIGFSYPNGAASEHTRSCVRNAGYGFACGSHNDLVSRGTDPYWLPRFWVPNWDGASMSRWLDRWLSI